MIRPRYYWDTLLSFQDRDISPGVTTVSVNFAERTPVRYNLGTGTQENLLINFATGTIGAKICNHIGLVLLSCIPISSYTLNTNSEQYILSSDQDTEAS